jgi:outer membrane protein TolC
MSSFWTLSYAKHAAARVVVGVALLWSPPTPAQQPATLTIDALVQAFRARNGLASFKSARAQLADARAKAAAGGFQEAPALSLEVEATPPQGATGAGNSSPPPSLSGEARAVVSQELVVGVDAAKDAARFRAQADTDILEKALELADEERALVASYLDLKKESLTFGALDAARPKIERYVSLSRQAARLGTLGGLAATQAELFLDQITSDLEQARLSFTSEAERLSAATGLALQTIDAARFEDLPRALPSAPAPASPPELAPVERRLEALALEQESLLARRSLELGIGVSQTWGETRDTSVIAELRVPLGVGAARKSEALALGAERLAVRAGAELVKAKAARELARVDAEIKRLDGAASRLEARVERLSSLFVKTESAFRRGQGDVLEVITTLRELLDARLEEIRTKVELETAHVSRLYLVRPVAS